MRTTGTGDASGPSGGAGAARTGPAAGEQPPDDDAWASDEARRIREEARRTREEMRAKFRARNHGEWSAWQERIGRPDWAGWAPWSDWGAENRAEEGAARPGTGPRTGRGGPNPFSDLERMAMQFANELRTAARQAGNVGERSLGDLRDILTDTLAKVRAEVFSESADRPGNAEADEPRQADDPEAGPQS
jgi:hypothetical protein